MNEIFNSPVLAELMAAALMAAGVYVAIRIDLAVLHSRVTTAIDLGERAHKRLDDNDAAELAFLRSQIASRNIT